jgi:hypothetical protein
MKPVIQFAAITLFIFSMSECQYSEKHRLFSKDLDTLLYLKNEKYEAVAIDTQKVKIENPKINSEIIKPQQPNGYGYGNDKYYMIVGCFLNQNFAEKYAEKVQQMGYHSQIILSANGYYRVSAQSYNSYRQGIKQIAEFRGKIASMAWLHVRK